MDKNAGKRTPKQTYADVLLRAKSRVVVQGFQESHLDIRIDAPTASLLVLQMVVSYAAAHRLRIVWSWRKDRVLAVKKN